MELGSNSSIVVQMETDPVSKAWIMDLATNTLILRMSIIFVTSTIIFLLNLVNLLIRKQFILSCTIQPIRIKKWKIPNCKYIIKLKLWKVYFLIQIFHVWIRHKLGVKNNLRFYMIFDMTFSFINKKTI